MRYVKKPTKFSPAKTGTSRPTTVRLVSEARSGLLPLTSSGKKCPAPRQYSVRLVPIAITC